MLCGKLSKLVGWMAVALTAAGCSADSELPDPKTLPSTFVETQRYNNSAAAVDLDGDGFDELVLRYQHAREVSLSHGVLLLLTHAGFAYEQLNYDGYVQAPLFLDFDSDGRPEILAPVQRNDSLFLSVANGAGRKLFSLFLTSGEPRVEPDGELPWDPYIVDAYLSDTDGDGSRELISVVNTRYARLPRGVFVHSMRDRRLLGSKIIGAFITQSLLEDFDGDGYPELLIGTAATKNGAQAGGFDDKRAYMLLLEMAPTPAVSWSRELKHRTRTRIVHEDFDGDGVQELLLAALGQAGTRVELIEPSSWRTYRERSVGEFLWVEAVKGPPVAIDLDRDARPEIVFMESAGSVLVLDANLDFVMRREVGLLLRELRVLPDLDNDGIREIALGQKDSGTLLLNPDLSVKAVWPTGSVSGVRQRGTGRAPEVLVEAESGSVVLELVANPFHWLYRYGPGAVWIVGVLGVVAITTALGRLRRRQRLSQTIQALGLDTADRGLLLLDNRGNIRWSNRTVRSWLAVNPEKLHDPKSVEELSALSPDLVEFCREAMAAPPPRQHSTSGTARIDAEDRRVAVSMDPVLLNRRGDPHWFLKVSELARSSNVDGSRTWPMMAQRVAHSLKNPLTSILLTLQRLQIEYRERAPAVANRLDRYSNRIEARIEELRRATNNFLKFVNVEAPQLVEVDPNEVVREFAESCLRSLPPDIRLNLKLGTKLPVVRLDREQMHDVLDNLVANAMNAMPDGGAITISTCCAEAVRLGEERAPGDYVEVEVMDTGTGIPDEIKNRLFEPGFSQEANGSGLGLAIVKKIVTDHEGVLDFESEVGTGSAFSMYLPIANATALRPRDGSERVTY